VQLQHINTLYFIKIKSRRLSGRSFLSGFVSVVLDGSPFCCLYSALGLLRVGCVALFRFINARNFPL